MYSESFNIDEMKMEIDNIIPSFNINTIYQEWKNKKDDINSLYPHVQYCSLQRQYRSLYIDEKDLTDFRDGITNDCNISAQGGGYYNTSWGIYRDIYTTQTFVYYITKDFSKINDKDFGIKSFDFIERSFEEIKRDSQR